MPDGFYKIADSEMSNQESFLGADGNALVSDEIFYAGYLLMDKRAAQLFPQRTENEPSWNLIICMAGSTVSESTQAVVIPDESFSLYVAEIRCRIGNLVGGTGRIQIRSNCLKTGNVLV